jgi:WD40 repeat protein
LWNLASRKPLQTRIAGTSPIRAVALLSNAIFAAGDDHHIRVWNAMTFEPSELTGHQSRVNCLAVSPDGSQLLSGDDDGTIRVWSLPRGAAGGVLLGHEGPVKSLAFVGDGRRAVSGGADSSVRLWQLPFP